MNIFNRLFRKNDDTSKTSPLNYDKAIILDSEELAEGSILEEYNKIRDQLKTDGIYLVEAAQDIDNSYKIIVGGKEIIVYDGDTPSDGGQHWGRSTFIFFNIINTQLAGWSKNLYALNGGNDLMGIFLTVAEFEEAKKSLKNKSDWPYIPNDKHPWYGMSH